MAARAAREQGERLTREWVAPEAGAAGYRTRSGSYVVWGVV